MLVTVRGKPVEGDLFLLVTGGVASFALLEAVALLGGPADERGAQQALPVAGALNLVAVGGALGAATGMAHLFTGALAWLFAPMAATALYLLLVALQASVVARRLSG
jgi:hypothetical protein